METGHGTNVAPLVPLTANEGLKAEISCQEAQKKKNASPTSV
jgi:antitoxin (DNA-binding transcriptional repressor) of toxin-antitoxin stability system